MSSLLVKIEDVDLFLPGDISQTLVLHEISWEIKSGEHWAILGPNGSGFGLPRAKSAGRHAMETLNHIL